MERTKFSVKLITVLSGFSGIKAYAAILGVLLACGLGVPVPEDITLISAGILAALKSIKIYGAIAVGLMGVMSGDMFLFFLGRLYGYRVFKLPLFRTVFTEKRIQLARQKVLANSKFICFTARFLPGLRAPIFLTAGIMGVRPVLFFALDAAAACISVPIWVYLGWYFGSNIDRALTIALRTQRYFVAGVTVLLLTYILWKIRVARNEEKLIVTVDAPPIPDEIIVQSPQE